MLKETGQFAKVCRLFVATMIGVAVSESTLAQTATNDVRLDRFSQPFEGDAQNAQSQRPLLAITGLEANDLLNMREQPQVGAPILNQLPAGSWALPELDRVDPEGNDGIAWVQTWYCGQFGWVAAQYVAAQPIDFPAFQDCPEGLIDPIAVVSGEEAEVEVADIAAVPDQAAVQADRLSIEDGGATQRDLGQSMLSTAYVACLSRAEARRPQRPGSTASDGDREREEALANEAVTRCLADERDRWEADMTTAFTLLVATLERADLRAVRNNQRDWQLALQQLCRDQALSKARPFTRLHLETCELKMTVDRAIDLESAIQARAAGFSAAGALQGSPVGEDDSPGATGQLAEDPLERDG